MQYVGIHKKGDFSLSDLLQSIKEKENSEKIGGIATFVGIVRGQTFDGQKVTGLEIEAYEDQANKILSEICNDLKKREGVFDVQIHHFVGKFSIGEDLVYIVVAGAHRENIFGVLHEAVERYKSETPVFKKEFIVDQSGVKESYWISEREIQEKRRKK
ncbi:MAG: molybdenum cofactor biosynthesis protein MoaE [Candidatus Bathyarchaeota archaeon]